MSTSRNPAHLIVLGDRRGIGWVLDNETVAFPEQRYKNTFPNFVRGDVIYLYATRGAFHNPTRDKGRIFARAVVRGPVERTKAPLTFRDRVHPLLMPVSVERLAPALEGVDLADLVPRMTSFPKPETWSVYLRRSTCPLTPEDAKLVDAKLKKVSGPLTDHLEDYLRLARTGLVYAGHER
ncbi:hypothetical protein SAMN04489844_2202 [Nocardioides exalbidus]|uniref:EVE domain-containing protein n=1 Tax=Nocardioides exalbidus TaxID=402596 RepID=A0A1H4S3Q7_9ACTN|nr:hypothetical protein [Nocardioides exalbidus]SEC38732.1 hypothetical protein SAMN04489844_2202 [Nocardioides exalbidus]